jgi:hypothetical protein
MQLTLIGFLLFFIKAFVVVMFAMNVAVILTGPIAAKAR